MQEQNLLAKFRPSYVANHQNRDGRSASTLSGTRPATMPVTVRQTQIVPGTCSLTNGHEIWYCNFPQLSVCPKKGELP
jgi:hypothetical protein